jgi:hypothetical protein
LRFSGTDNDGTPQVLTTSYVEYSEAVTKPGGGAWSVAEINGTAWEAGGLREDTGTIRCTQMWVVISYDEVTPYDPPTDLEADYQSSPATNVSEAPKFTAIFNGDSVPAVAAQVQVSEDDTFSSAGMVWDSDWQPLSSPGCNDGERCEGIIYGQDLSNPPILSSDPPAAAYYWRIRFADAESGGIESEWSDYTSADPALFSGINREWALPNYAYRKKLLWDKAHTGVPAGHDQPFTLETGVREQLAANGCFDESVAAAGGFQVESYGNRTHVVYLSLPDTESAQYGIYIKTRNDETGEWGEPYRIAASGSTLDIHYFPTLVIDGDGYIHVAFGSHNSDFQYSRSVEPNVSGSIADDLSSSSAQVWFDPQQGSAGSPASGPITGFVGTYPVGFYVASKDRVYWFWRRYESAHNHQSALIYSDDNGETWSTDRLYIHDTDGSAFRVYTYGIRFDPVAERLYVSYTHNHSGDIETGIWCVYSDLDETDSVSATTHGFNIWHWLDGDVAGYTEGGSGSQIDYTPAKAISLRADTLSRIFTETLVIDRNGDPVVFWEQKVDPGSPFEETHLCCATWDGSWSINYISDQVNYMLAIRKCGVGVQRDNDHRLRLFMPVNMHTRWHFNPTADVDDTDITPLTSGANNYEEIDEGPTDCDKDVSYFTVGSSGVASFTSSTTMNTAAKTIFEVEIEAVVRYVSSGTSCVLYLSNGSIDDDSSSISIASATYSAKSAIWTTNPFTSAPWEIDDLNGLIFGIKQNGAQDFRVTRLWMRAKYTVEADDEWGGTRIIELASSDNGNTWSTGGWVTANNHWGFNHLNHAHHYTNNKLQIIWSSAPDIFYLTGERYGLMRADGEDIRVVYGGVEIDRVIDYPNMPDSELRISVQETIPAGCQSGPDDYYVYYGYRDETTAPKADPHQVFELFENWEEYNHGDNLETSESGWVTPTGSITCYEGPPNDHNKVAAGQRSCLLEADGSTTGIAEFDLGGTLENTLIESVLWAEQNGARLHMEVGSGSSTFSVGLRLATSAAEYSIDGSYTDVSGVKVARAQMFKVAIKVTENGCSAWINDYLVVENVSGSLTDIDTLRFYWSASINYDAYTDFIRVGHELPTASIVDVQDQESRGITFVASILGRGRDQFTLLSRIQGWRPLPISVIASTTNPTVILGSITTTPSAASAIASTTNPAVLLGSTTAAPTAISAIASVTDPIVVIGALAITPAAISAIASTTNPTIVLGSLSIMPAASSTVASTTNPVVVLGSDTSSPAAIDAIASTTAPNVVLGSVVIQPAAISVVASTTDPAVELGSVIASPASISAIASTTAPTIVLSSVTATPDAIDAIASTTDPAVLIGALAVTPAAISAIASTTDPDVVRGSITITPAAISAVASTTDPNVILGSTIAAPDAIDVIASTTNPTVVTGGIVITPAAISAVASTTNPTVIKGSVSVSPSAISAIASTDDPTVVKGSVNVTPDSISAIASTVDPVVVVGGIVITPAAIACIAGVIDPSVVLGSVSIGPGAATVIVSTGDPVVVLGATAVTPAPISTIASVTDPSVEISGIVVTPDAIYSVAATVTPGVVLGSITIEASVISSIASTTDPTVVITGIVLDLPEGRTVDIAAQDRMRGVNADSRWIDIANEDRQAKRENTQ